MKLLRIACLTSALVLSATTAFAQGNPAHMGPMGAMPMHHNPAGDMMGQQPRAPGQAAFGAIQEIVNLLQADPKTDWSKVDIDALRQHLIDMDEVTLRAVVRKEPIDNGLRMTVTGTGRTLEAIQRMIPDHAREIDGTNGWTVRAAPNADSVVLTVTAANAAEAVKIRALGFMGIMAQGGHHQRHHLAMAKGEMAHRH